MMSGNLLPIVCNNLVVWCFVSVKRTVLETRVILWLMGGFCITEQ